MSVLCSIYVSRQLCAKVCKLSCVQMLTLTFPGPKEMSVLQQLPHVFAQMLWHDRSDRPGTSCLYNDMVSVASILVSMLCGVQKIGTSASGLHIALVAS